MSHTSQELAEQCLLVAQRVDDLALRQEAHHALAWTLFALGELASARTHCEHGVALYDPQHHRALAFIYGTDPGVHSLALMAWPLWLLGYPDQALQRCHEARRLSQEVSHSRSLIIALFYSVVCQQFRREVPVVHAQAAEAIALGREQGAGMYVGAGTILHGWAQALRGHGGEAIAQIHQALAAYQATGATVLRSYLLAMLVEAYAAHGQVEEALHVQAEALAHVAKHSERFYEAELHRLKGTCLLHQTMPEVSQAEACFHQALDVARAQQAKSWELRAAISLAQLWKTQAKRQEAHALLAPVYGWFAEGFDTADLKDAKALLDELAEDSL